MRLKSLTFAAIVLSVMISGCGGSSAPDHTEADYKSAVRSDLEVTAHQETYSDDDILTASSTLTFGDQSTQSSMVTLTFDGVVNSPPGWCVFHIDDLTDKPSDKSLEDSKKLIKPCNGSDVAEFSIAGNTISLKSRVVDDHSLTNLHIDEIYGPKDMKYNEGHGRSSTDEENQDDRP